MIAAVFSKEKRNGKIARMPFPCLDFVTFHGKDKCYPGFGPYGTARCGMSKLLEGEERQWQQSAVQQYSIRPRGR